MQQSIPENAVAWRAAGTSLRSHLLVVLALLAVGGVTAADEGDDAVEALDSDADGNWEIATAPVDDAIDEIIVVAPKSVPAIRAQIIRVERRMYGLYNEMNTDREFDIYCRRENVYASRRKERVCLPQFERGVLEEAWDDLSTWTGAGRPQAELQQKREILRRKMIDFAEQNPALRDAIYERARLQRSLQEAEAREAE